MPATIVCDLQVNFKRSVTQAQYRQTDVYYARAGAGAGADTLARPVRW